LRGAPAPLHTTVGDGDRRARVSASVVVLSKDEPELDATLVAVTAQRDDAPVPVDVLVVDASSGRLDAIRRRHADAVAWIDFPPGVGGAVTIAAQRNAGVRASAGDLVVFIDAGCLPRPGWLTALLGPLVAGAAEASAGREAGSGTPLVVDGNRHEAPSLNLAFTRAAFERVGGFDEAFAYGSDIDFTWRLVDAGVAIRDVPDAIVEHRWGGARRRIRRGWSYGRARTRLYRKHPRRLRGAWRTDPMVLTWPPFVAGLPLALAFPPYLALLAIPAWRARHDDVATTLAHHLAFGAGALRELARRGA
jgi:glycosyltransferase involved in cell wall biosynthesis